ncbi:TlpA family protein disulfide reductase [candidate division WOR-3 bacterium]|nr:TlpA family protein disulfide reductase [candidate division WOR-3 bacterium]
MNKNYKILMFIIISIIFITDCRAKTNVVFKSSGEDIVFCTKRSVDSLLIAYRIYDEQGVAENAVVLYPEGKEFSYKIPTDSSTILLEYYIEDYEGYHYPYLPYFYSIIFKANRKVVKNAYINYAKDLYRSGYTDFKTIDMYIKKELNLYPNNYYVYAFIENIKNNLDYKEFNIVQIAKNIKNRNVDYYNTFIPILSRYNISDSKFLFNEMLAKNINCDSLSEFFGRVLCDTVYIDSIASLYNEHSYYIYKMCLMSALKYRIKKNYSYYTEKIRNFAIFQEDELANYLVLKASRDNIYKLYEQFIEKFSSSKYLNEINRYILLKMIPNNKDKALYILNQIDKNNYSPNDLNSISYELSVNGIGIYQAKILIESALNKFKFADITKIYFNSTIEKRNILYKTNIAYMLDTYGYIHLQGGKLDSSKMQFIKAIDILDSIGEEDATILIHYAYILEKENINEDSLMTIYGKIIAIEDCNEIIEKIKELYKKTSKPEKEFNRYVKKLKRKYRALKRVDVEIKNYSFKDTNEKNYELADFMNRVIVITFTKNDCGFCRAEAYDLKNLEEEYKDSKSVVFIHITSDSKSKALEFKKKYKLKGLMIAGNRNISRELGITGFPTNIIIGPDGRIHYRIRGYFTDIKDMIEEIIKNELFTD